MFGWHTKKAKTAEDMKGVRFTFVVTKGNRESAERAAKLVQNLKQAYPGVIAEVRIIY